MVVETIPRVHVFRSCPRIRQKIQRQRKSDRYGYEKLDSKSEWARAQLGGWKSKDRLEESCLDISINRTEISPSLAYRNRGIELSTRLDWDQR